MFKVVLNCDCGEGVGDDAAIMPYVTAANIACGAHAGSPEIMRQTLHSARQHSVSYGAHPGYPDREHFGRRVLPMSLEQIIATVLSQIQALSAIAREEAITLTHVKPHGALYNHAAVTPDVASAIASAVAQFDANLIFVGLSNSSLIEAGRSRGLRVAREAFADRAYEADGTLRSRALPGALIEDAERCLEQAISIVKHAYVTAHSGSRVAIEADTICVHSDTPGAAQRAAVLSEGLSAAGIQLVTF